MAIRHHPEKETRGYIGEGMGLAVARFLNGEGGRPNQQNVDRVLTLVNTLKEILRRSKWSAQQDRLVAKGKAFERLVTVFNRLSKRYKMAPHIGRTAATGEWRFTEISTRRGAGEFVAARCAIDLADAGLLHSLVKCRHCQRWLFARFRHQEFCCKECRRKHHALSDHWKAYKRKKAREYYWLHKSGKVKER
jgi:hypothetical protein